MKTVYKYPLDILPEQTIEIPAGFDLLDIQRQHGRPCIWALVDSESIPLFTKIYFYYTGDKIEDPDLIYIGTYQYAGGNLVYHVFYKIL